MKQPWIHMTPRKNKSKIMQCWSQPALCVFVGFALLAVTSELLSVSVAKETKDRGFINIEFLRLGHSTAMPLQRLALSGYLIHVPKLDSSINQQSVDKVIVTCDVEPLPALRQALKHPNWRVRQQAAIALGKLGIQAESAIPDLTAALQDENYEVIIAVVDALGNMGKEAASAVPSLIKLLTHPPYGEPLLSQRVELALVQIGKPAVPELIKLLDSRFDNVRFPAISALRQIGKPAVPDLIQALKSPQWTVRYAAADALIMGVQAKEAVPSLIERLTSKQNGEPDGFVRSQIIETLGANRIEAQLVVPVLIESMPHPSAVKALGKFGAAASQAVPNLAQLLRDRNSKSISSRIEAVITLSKIGQSSRAAIADLKYSLTDPNYIVRNEAAAAIVNLGITSEFDTAIATVVDLLKSVSTTERYSGIETLNKIGAVSAKQSILGLVQVIQNDREPDVQLKATTALIKISYAIKKHQGYDTISNLNIQLAIQGLETAQKVWQQRQQQLNRLSKQPLQDVERDYLLIAQEVTNLLLQKIHHALETLQKDRELL